MLPYNPAPILVCHSFLSKLRIKLFVRKNDFLNKRFRVNLYWKRINTCCRLHRGINILNNVHPIWHDMSAWLWRSVDPQFVVLEAFKGRANILFNSFLFVNSFIKLNKRYKQLNIQMWIRNFRENRMLNKVLFSHITNTFFRKEFY